MDSDHIPIILSALAFIAFYSGIEIAYLSSNKFKIELDSKQGLWSARILSFFAKSPSKFICTILIGLNISLVVYGTYMQEMLSPVIEQYIDVSRYNEFTVLIIETFITTIFLLIAGEFLPKVLFSINPNQTLSFFSGIIWISYILLFPAVWIILTLTHFLLKLIFRVDFTDDSPTFGRVDLDNYISDIRNNTSAKSELNKEIKMFQNALDFDSLKVRQCMIPRTEIVALNVKESIESLRRKFVETGLSKILIFQENKDNIIGFVHSYEMFKQPANISAVLLPVSIFPETAAAKDLLTHFTENHRSVAVVVDEFGLTAGMATVEDIMEEIFGEINDEHDVEEHTEKKISETEFLFAGRLEIDFINKKYDLKLPEDDSYTTLAGLIFHHHEDIPHAKEEISIFPYRLTILSVSGNKIEQVRVRLLTNEE